MDRNEVCGYGWTCPRCNRVYGPMVSECAVCNGATGVPDRNKDEHRYVYITPCRYWLRCPLCGMYYDPSEVHTCCWYYGSTSAN
jgi:hypothetical protein